MASNPFVNPNQRGMELPAGCKDLMDVLKKGGSERPGAGRPVILYGVLSEVERRVEAFSESGAGERLFSVGIQGRGIHLILVKRGEDLSLNFSVPAKHQSLKDAVRRIFENPKFGENKFGQEYVSVALKAAKDSVARMMVKLLVEGYGVLEGEQLMFVSYERAERTGER
jgi:hypothetical protein